MNKSAVQRLRDYSAAGSGTMTVTGAVNKSIILFLILLIGASVTWYQPVEQVAGLMWLGVIGGLIAAVVTIFKIEWSPFTAPLYAVLEGLAVGGISNMYAQMYEGIVMNAVMLTMGTLFALLLAYRSGLIKVTQRFRMGVVAATGGIALVYLATWILGFFGVQVGLVHGNGLFGIGFSLIVVVVAALNLVLDFDFFEQGEKMGAPEFVEWYAAFGLMVTLIWLYIEMLRLLSKLQSRR